jgi:predicted SnoaL-like aldol condensation-catalyzing enzyme
MRTISMHKTLAIAAVAIGLTTPAWSQTRDMGPMSPCTLTPAQIEEGRKVALQFFAPGVDRLAITDPSYKQHNPAFVKGARDAGMTDFDYFKTRFGGPPAARGGGAPGGGPRAGGPAGPQPPAGNPTELVVTECDVTTIMHRNNRQDPTAAPGTFYEAFTFDMFRVRNGKLVEHWDGAVINPPAPAGAPGGGRGN